MRRASVQAIARRPDWLPRLEAALARARFRPFRWGVQDCCLFPADCVRAMTGVDLARGWRGRYRSLRGALRLLAECGGVEGLAERCAAPYGIPGWPAAAQARRGDVVLLDAQAVAEGLLRMDFGPGGPQCLAVVGLAGTEAWALGQSGLIPVPLPAWRRAWRIG